MKARNTISKALPVAVYLAVLLVFAQTASACPSCRQALSAEGGDLARGIYYSVLFMMSMPFAIVGTFGFMAYRAIKREQRRLADEGQENPDRDSIG